MEELREKAKHSIALKKPLPPQDALRDVNPSNQATNGNIGNHNSHRDSDLKKQSSRDERKHEVSESIQKYNDSESSRTKDLKRKESRRSGSSRHRDGSRHKKSRHRDSSRRSRKKRRRSSSSKSSKSRGSSYERRRRRKERKRRRRSSSSTSSRGRHHSSKYSSRRRKRNRRSKSSSSSSSSNGSRKGSSSVIPNKRSHPYFSRLGKIRRERLKKEKQERFWDGFQWVSKESIALASQDPTLHLKNKELADGADLKKDEKIVTGKDLRRVVATNLPLDYGINQEDLANYLIVRCKENGDDILFRSIFLNYEQNSGIIECMEKEQTNILNKLDGIALFGHTLRFTKVADENGFIHGGDSENLLKDSAQLTAQAAAIVSSRIRGLQGKGGNANLNLIGDSFSTSKPSRYIKLMNTFDRYEEISAQMFEEMYEDMEEMMLNFGQFNMLKIIRNGEEKLGAEVGSVFVEFSTEEEAKNAKEAMKGKIYDGREIKAIFVQEEVFKKELE